MTHTGRLGDWMEQMMKEAQQRGDFDNLPGKGKPLALPNSDPFAGPDELVYRTLKEAGFTPEWVELRKKIVAEINWLRDNKGDPMRPSRVVETNVMIDRHNRQVPNPTLSLPKLPSTFPE